MVINEYNIKNYFSCTCLYYKLISESNSPKKMKETTSFKQENGVNFIFQGLPQLKHSCSLQQQPHVNQDPFKNSRT